MEAQCAFSGFPETKSNIGLTDSKGRRIGAEAQGRLPRVAGVGGRESRGRHRCSCKAGRGNAGVTGG